MQKWILAFYFSSITAMSPLSAITASYLPGANIWDANASWNPATTPNGAGDTANFDQSYTNSSLNVVLSLSTKNITIGNINVIPLANASTITFIDGGSPENSLIFEGGTATYNTNSNTVFSCKMQVPNGANFQTNNSNTVSFTKPISGSGDINLTSGAYSFSGLNTYTGTLSLNSNASLVVTSGGRLGDNTAKLNLASDSALFNISGSSTTTQTIGGLSGVSNSTINLANRTLVVDQSDSSTFAGNFIGTSGGLTKTGSGTLTLAGTNTQTGLTMIEEGVLSISPGATIGGIGASVRIEGGALQFTGTNSTSVPATIINTATVDISGASSIVTYSGAIVGSGSLVKNGEGTLLITANNSFSGSTTINNGTIQVSGSGGLGAGPFLNLANSGAKLDVSNITGFAYFSPTLIGVSGTSIVLGGKTLFVNSSVATPTEFAGVISGVGGSFTKNGNGLLTFSGLNTYTGTTTVNGTLLLTGEGRAGNGTSPLSLSPNASLDISGINSTTSIGNLSGGANTSLVLGSKNLTINQTTNATYSGIISGDGGTITKSGGTQQLTLTGINTYTGGSVISNGTLALSGSGTAGNGTAPMNLTVSGATFSISAITPSSTSIGALSGLENTSVALGQKNLTINALTPGNFAGVISSGLSGSLTKTGIGTQIFSGINTYTGSTTIANGILALAGSGTAGSATSPISISDGASLDISGVTSSTTIGPLTGSSNSSVALGDKNLIVNMAASSTYDGVISGLGGTLTKIGAGTLTLTGNNTHTGGVLVNSGTLALTGSGTACGSTGTVELAPLTTFDLSGITSGSTSIGSIIGTATSTINLGDQALLSNTSTNTTYSGGIIGTNGSFIKQGIGTQIFDGSAKSYGGGTTVDEGVLQLDTANQMAGNILLNTNGTVDLEAFASETYSGQITGAGRVDINRAGGSGAVILSNSNNTYSGETNVVQGTLRAGVAGAFSSSSKVVLGNGSTTSGTLDMNGFANSIAGLEDSFETPGSVLLSGNLTLTGNGASSTTFYGRLSGTGSLILNGASADLTLAGTNTCTVQIDQGMLNGTTDNLPPTIVVGAAGALTVNQVTNSTYVGTVTGAGVIDKTGTGTLFLTTGSTNLSGFTGDFLVSDGIAKLNTLIGSNVNVRNTGTLSGIGTVGGNLDVQTGGTIAPGNSIGTINVVGNYVQNVGSTYLVEIDGAGNSTLINVTGSATLNGGLVDITSNDGVLTEDILYTIIHASGGLTGTFESAVARGFADGGVGIPLLSYTATDALFMFASKSVFPKGTTSNQKAVAVQLGLIQDPTSDLSNVLINLIGLSGAEQDAALDAMAGEQYTNYLNMTEISNRQFLRRLYDPIQPMVTGDLRGCCSPCQSLNGVWFEGGASRSYFKGNLNAGGYKSHGYELAGGLQALVAESVVIGAAGGFAKDEVNFSQYARGRNSTSFAGMYSLYRPAGYYVFADVVYGYSANRVRRSIQFGDIDKIAKGCPKISQTTFYAEGGLDFNLKKILVQPFLAIEADYYFNQKINEKGADSLNLKIYSQTRQKTFSRLGFHLTSRDLPWGISFSVDLAWQYRLTGLKNQTNSRFLEFGDQFVVEGVTPERNAFEGSVILACQINNSTRFFVEFSGERWNRANAFSSLCGLQLAW